jgi:hypothetical protein
LIWTLLAAGCGETPTEGALPGRDSGAWLQTDTTVYRLRKDWVGWEAVIPFAYRNLASDTLFVVNCRRGLSISLERWQDSTWVRNWGSLNALCLSPPIVIPPGVTYVDTLFLWGAEPGESAEPAYDTSEIEGIYRIVWQSLTYRYADGPQPGGEVPLDRRISNRFVLRKWPSLLR